MDRNDHLWRELDAAGEKFVRRHLAMGGYDARRKPVVEQWLQLKDAERAQVSALCLKIAAAAAVISAVAAVLSHWASV